MTITQKTLTLSHKQILMRIWISLLEKGDRMFLVAHQVALHFGKVLFKYNCKKKYAFGDSVNK